VSLNSSILGGWLAPLMVVVRHRHGMGLKIEPAFAKHIAQARLPLGLHALAAHLFEATRQMNRWLMNGIS
jgi:hypothetical protein